MVRILLIDDNPDDRTLAIRELSKVFTELNVTEATDIKSFEQILSAETFDSVITDYRLRWSDGITILRAVKARYPDLPVVMFTNSGNEEIAVEAMKAGLDDYVIKSYNRYFRLPIAIRIALEQAQQRQALKQAENRYSTLFDRVPVGLYQITPQGQIIEANPALAELLGYSDRQALLNVNAVDVHVEADVKQQWRERMERDDILRNYETPIRTLDGRIIWVRHNARAIKNVQGEVLYYEGAIEDLTERKRVEEERIALLAREQAARAQAEAANRMKDEFLATLSHELRTPLNSMLGWANLLRNRKLNEVTIARALETIERNAKAQNQMIEDLLDVSRIIRGKLRLTISRVDIAAVIDAAMEAVQPAADAKAISLEKFYEIANTELPGKGVAIAGDSSRLQQIVWNLLTNAIKFTPVGGRVEVRLSVKGESLEDNTREQLDEKIDVGLPLSSQLVPFACIQVKDTGQGISADFIPHLFEHFRQADSTTTRAQGGLGLGLAIVRQLVEMHGGSVCAYSPGVGQGATFTVKLPLMAKVKTQEPGQEDNEKSLLPIIGKALHPAPITLKGIKILVVDDELDTREMLTTVLEFYGLVVTAVASVAEAKIAIAKSPPDILISDIAMPEADGYDLISFVKKQGSIPAIALTAYARELDRNTAIAAGFQQHISKPVEPEKLVAAVAELVANKEKVGSSLPKAES